ncbi:ERV-BabFcenv provirus ancestral Env polyprotein-like [Rana temporaria]|uniref:ERV-BabFcenv provirus ancestral Env polyprotein-like n=1 Tax=Rana temporaria TaxID=8407 RepID=UPI001AACC1C2|nr:ERV-BabFcenv provirus ancestral Env polyprotein-like [Rana temporaria]
MKLYILLFTVTIVYTQKVAIRETDHRMQFWYNSSNTHVATFIFDFCTMVSVPQFEWQCNVYQRQLVATGDIYICDTVEDCDNWESVGWKTGDGWEYRPQSGLNKKDKHGEPLLDRLSLTKTGIWSSGEEGHSTKLILTIKNPSPTDAGTYVIGVRTSGGERGPHAQFQIKDMYNSSEWKALQAASDSPEPQEDMRTLDDIVAIADPTFEDTMAAETGFSDVNLWLEWMRYSAGKHKRSNCYVCSGAKPHLGTVPLNIPPTQEECFLSLFTNTTTDHSQCETWKKEYPIITKTARPGEGITIYPGNYTCYGKYQGAGRFLGNFSEGYCASYSSVPADLVQNQIQSLGDVYWICGDMKIRTKLTDRWTGECALAKVIMPLHIFSVEDLVTQGEHSNRERKSAPAGSFDPHVYIDAIGVPRGVPDEFKARDQVAADFESLIPIITINKNVDWINYIYYNQQRFVNYTRDALQGIAEQLEATSRMTFQNRKALDMILAEMGGVCKILPGTSTCSTYIPDNTGPNGKVTLAIKKLEELSKELKINSGLTDPWDQYFGWMKGWQRICTQIGIAILFLVILVVVMFYCILPCIKKLLGKAAEEVTPTF